VSRHQGVGSVVGLYRSQQMRHDAEPFRIKRLPANWFASPTVPICRIVFVAFLAMEVGVHPRTIRPLRPAGPIRVPVSNHPWHPTTTRRGHA